jgi:hypothetical protein
LTIEGVEAELPGAIVSVCVGDQIPQCIIAIQTTFSQGVRV